jgi:hypothetical protein
MRARGEGKMEGRKGGGTGAGRGRNDAGERAR